MKSKEKSQKAQSLNLHTVSFWKANWALLALLFLAFVVIVILLFVLVAPRLNQQSVEKDLANNKQTTSLFSIGKIVCYSNAYGTNKSENQANWNLDLSQYTDIAIYLNSQLEVSNMYIDNISFSNSSIGKISLNTLSLEEFGKSPVSNSSSLVSEDSILENSITNSEISDNQNSSSQITDNSNSVNLLSNSQISNSNNIADLSQFSQTPERIVLNMSSPITLRYLNQNLKENCLIADIDNPLSFDGSLLKRGKVTLSSLKNTISFNLHVVSSANESFTYPVTIPINLENKETGKSIYDGSYMEELI